MFVLTRGPEDGQLGAPASPEDGGGGGERQTPESCLLRPAAAAHRLAAHQDSCRVLSDAVEFRKLSFSTVPWTLKELFPLKCLFFLIIIIQFKVADCLDTVSVVGEEMPCV